MRKYRLFNRMLHKFYDCEADSPEKACQQAMSLSYPGELADEIQKALHDTLYDPQ